MIEDYDVLFFFMTLFGTLAIIKQSQGSLIVFGILSFVAFVLIPWANRDELEEAEEEEDDE